MKDNATSRLEELLRQSVDSSKNPDTSELQQNIIAKTANLPQQQTRKSALAKQLSWFKPLPRLVIVACLALVSVAVVFNYSGHLPPKAISEFAIDEDNFILNDAEFENQKLAQIAWAEMMLLEDELGFGEL